MPRDALKGSPRAGVGECTPPNRIGGCPTFCGKIWLEAPRDSLPTGRQGPATAISEHLDRGISNKKGGVSAALSSLLTKTSYLPLFSRHSLYN
jgi:hypothetical protein